MDIQKLQALAVIQEAGSFSRAAETLGYSQAGLTYMMNSLENEIGLRLLDRGYSGVRLSETGKTLMPKIHRLLQVYDALNGEINACKCAQQATLRLAALDTVSTRWVPRAVAALKAEYPQITVSVISGSPMQVDNWLRDGSVELGVTDKRFTGTDMDWIRLCDDPFLAVLPPDSDVPDPVPVTWFAGRAVIIPDYGTNTDTTRVFTDSCGREVTVPTDIQKAAVSVGQLLLPVCLAFFISRNMSTSNLYLVATAILVIAGIVIARAPFPPLTKAPEKGSVPVDEDGNARFNSKPKLWLEGACLIAIGFTSTASFTLFSNWVKIFGQEIIGMSETSAAYCISMYSTTSIIGVVVTSIAIKKFIKPCRLLVVYPLLSVVALLLLAFAPSAAVCRIASIVIGWTAAGGVLQMAVAVMADLFPMGKGKVTSVVYMLCSICMLVIPTVAGWVYKASGSTSVMLLNAGITLLGALLGVVVNVRYNMLTKGVATA